MRYLIFFLLALCMVGCSISSRLQRRQSRAMANYTPREKVETAKEITQRLMAIKTDSATYYLAPVVTDENGERMMGLTIDEVVVVAKSRTLSERDGKVTIDFVITLPRELQGSCQSVVVTPMLHKSEQSIPLEELSIRGGLFARVQDRNYWQFNQYVRVFRPDALTEQRVFEHFVKHPYPQGVRLDSIAEGREKISYYYAQDVSTEGEGKVMQITLQGRAVALDGSSYKLPPLDTLQYNISSMLSFVDTTTHYLTRIINKYAVVNDKNYLSFKVNDTRILDTLGDNRPQLDRIEGLMEELVNQSEFYIDSITLTATASPEGTRARNEALAKGRALSLKKRLSERFGRGIDTLITVRWVAEDWQELARLITHDDKVEQKEAILKLIRNSKEPDQREATLRRLYPLQYRYIRKNLYPMLRSVSFKYDLRRVGMIQDTVHTTEPDTLYARGVELLERRRYAEALYILGEYKDQNSAVAYLSLGKDNHAYDILCHLPQRATTEYLLAIACSRLGRIDEGRRHFVRACELNNTLEYRGKLDPEIGTLLIAE